MVVGIGGAGNHTIKKLLEDHLEGAECVAVNTDLRDLNCIDTSRRVLIGEKTTRGLSANGNPSIGRAAAEGSRFDIEKLLENVDVVFLTLGIGGGTGTGAAPVIAEIARRKGAVVVGVVTTPLKNEKDRVEPAARMLNELQSVCDTLVVIDNNKLTELFPRLPASEVFKVADQVLANMIKGIVETISMPSLISLDLSAFKTVVKNGGVAVVGVGESSAPNRAEEAVQNALKTPLLNVDYSSAKGALVQVSGDPNLTVEEVNRVGEIVRETVGEDVSVVSGARVDSHAEGLLKVTLVVTGADSPYTLSRLVEDMPKLYDIESSFSEPEKTLPVDLGLDQIESLED